jgi:flagellar biosynthetic protein FliR
MAEFLKLLELVLKIFEVGQNPQDFLILFILAFSRFFAFIAFVPFLGGQLVPAKVKIAVATALVIIAYPSLTAELPSDGSQLGFGVVNFVGLIAKEVFVGCTLGFVASLVFEAVRIAGKIADFQRGLMTNELFNFQTQQVVSQFEQFQFQLAIIVFLTIGAHRFFISSLLKSFEVIPILKFPHLEAGWTPAAQFLTVMTAGVLNIGVQLAAPIVITLLLTDLLFGLINRIAPQINVFFLSLPAKMWIGIFVLSVMITFLIEQFRDLFDSSFRSFEVIIQYFSNMFPK